MRNHIKLLAILSFSILSIVSCGASNVPWSKDSTYHWHTGNDKEMHSFEDEVTPATYDECGYTTHTCTVCGYSYVDGETDKLAHKYSPNWSYDSMRHWHQCIDDGYEDLKSDRSLHTFKTEIMPASYESGGYTTHTCTVCGYSYVDSESDQLEHLYSDEWTHDESKHWHACVDNGYETLKTEEAFHDFVDEVTEPTYEHGGYTTHTCSICGYLYVDNETEPIGITITWKNYDGTILEIDNNVLFGTDPSYDGEIPHHVDDAQFYYTFIGWSPNVVKATEDVTYIAQYSTTYKTYCITWSINGNEITEKYRYGDTPVFKGSTDKEADEFYSYSFSGWYPEITSVSEDVTYIAQYSFNPIIYTISYEMNGGDSSNPNSFSIESGDFILEIPKKNGYKFVGWTGSNGNVPEIDVLIKCDTCSDLYFIANWQIESYPISYYLFGGTNSIKNPDFYCIEDTVSLNPASKEGYIFLGWFSDEKFEHKVDSLYGLFGALDLYASFVPRSYSATFIYEDYYLLEYDCEESENDKTIKIHKDDIVHVYDYIPQKDGYIFDGWYNENDILITKDFSLTKDITIHPKWVDKKNSKYLDWTIYSPSIMAQIHTYNYQASSRSKELFLYVPTYCSEEDMKLAVELRDNFYSRAECYIKDVTRDFTCFSKSTSFTSETNFAKTITVHIYPGHLYYFKVYAYAESGGSTAYITYSSGSDNQGKCSFDNFILSKNETTSYFYDSLINSPTPHKDGYDFAGWYDNDNNLITDTWNYTSDQEFHADWKIHNYHINYELNGGVNDPNNPSSYTINDNVTLYNPVKDGYSFDGWYADSTFKVRKEELQGTDCKDYTLYAKWTPNTYTATLEYEGGQNCPTINFYSQGSIIKIVDLYKDSALSYFVPESPSENLKFGGWYIDPSFTTFFSFEGVVNTDLNLYAKWIDVSDYSYLELGSSLNVDINGNQYNYIAITSPVAQIVTFSSKSNLDLFGAVYDENWNEISSCDDISDENLDFSITINIEPGKTYFLSYKANQVLGVGNCTISISGTNLPEIFITGDYTQIIESINITYDSSFDLPTPKKEGYIFMGWFDENGEQIDTSKWNYLENITIYAHWIPKM